ncbi:MAG: ArsA family ATPase [Candidatus Thermoplasmatota archaeon]
MPLAGLETKRLIIVSGKGGVGKTTTSAAIALELARKGRKTLLVTVDPAKRLEDSLGVPVGSEATPIQPRLWAMMLDPSATIAAHFRERMPEAKVADHPLFKTVTSHLPGINELMAIGKLNDLRRANAYDAIVVDTAPTGHALSFLSAPAAIREVLADKSLVSWAIKGYAVYQKLAGAARKLQGVFQKEKREAPPDIDFEKIFEDMDAEASRIQEFLRDPEHSALVLVALPEKLPVEETCDLHAAVVALGMTVHAVVVNKVQPPFGANAERLDALAGDAKAAKSFAQKAASATGDDAAFLEALVAAAEFGRIRRHMNLEWLAVLEARLPDVPKAELPLFREDVQGLKRLASFRAALFESSAPA